MKLIIDIPDEVYKRIEVNKDYDICALTYAIDNAIKNGDEIPKGHGRIIDEQALVDIIERRWKNKQITDTKYNTFLEILDYVPTVVDKEADNE